MTKYELTKIYTRLDKAKFDLLYKGQENMTKHDSMDIAQALKAVKITAQCYFIGDIAPEIAVISNGEAEVFGEKRRIFSGEKARNPDGADFMPTATISTRALFCMPHSLRRTLPKGAYNM